MISEGRHLADSVIRSMRGCILGILRRIRTKLFEDLMENGVNILGHSLFTSAA